MTPPDPPANAPRPIGETIPIWLCVVAAATITAVAALTLRWLGRVPFSTSGIVRVWSGDAWGAESSQQLFDPYTFTHLTHGVLLFAALGLFAGRVSLRARAVLAVAIEAAWEVIENTETVIDRYRETTMALGYYGDSVFNSVGDILACAVGFLLAARLPSRATLALVIGMEAVLALWIRDGFFINVVMLIYPFEGLKAWQLGAG